ncbi:MAG TPA: hypothetical protein VJJ82_00095 [Candidatus Nanoarchaeia archaeon]|nr:hypothetical protein [Candidatus Nanoarchaeia archaeon]
MTKMLRGGATRTDEKKFSQYNNHCSKIKKISESSPFPVANIRPH